KRQQQYTAEDLENAVKAVKNGLLIREASRSDNIPYSTLNDHVNENVTSFGSGRISIFSEIEEMNLMNAVLVLQVNNFFILLVFSVQNLLL
ncbi:unnamed protein product, partial [Didymodactylos carnosus]